LFTGSLVEIGYTLNVHPLASNVSPYLKWCRSSMLRCIKFSQVLGQGHKHSACVWFETVPSLQNKTEVIEKSENEHPLTLK